MKAYTFRWIIGITYVYQAVVFAISVKAARMTLAKRMIREGIHGWVADETEIIKTPQHWKGIAKNAIKSRVISFSSVEKPELIKSWLKKGERRRQKIQRRLHNG